MEWLFGKKVTPEEMLRKNQRALNKAMRDLDRERMRMEQQEKKIIADIKKLAKDNQMVIVFNFIIFYLLLIQPIVIFEKNFDVANEMHNYVFISGCCENHGQRFSKNTSLH